MSTSISIYLYYIYIYIWYIISYTVLILIHQKFTCLPALVHVYSDKTYLKQPGQKKGSHRRRFYQHCSSSAAESDTPQVQVWNTGRLASCWHHLVACANVLILASCLVFSGVFCKPPIRPFKAIALCGTIMYYTRFRMKAKNVQRSEDQRYIGLSN